MKIQTSVAIEILLSMTSSALPGTLNAKDSGEEGGTICATVVADKSKNGEC